MKRFYLTGQHTFGNRGCEAIVRSTVGLLQQQFGAVEVLVPSDDIPRDSAHWPDAADQGVRFVPVYLPFHARYWVHLQRLPIPALKRAGWPFPMPQALKNMFRHVDAVLSVGGDNYSLDYRLPSWLMGMDRLAMNLGKPVILWGASVGPFEREAAFVPAIRQHLADMVLIAVRESVTEAYLKKTLGLNNVIRMVDPAFTLMPEPLTMNAFWPEDQGYGILGLNISPLIERYRRAGQDLRTEIVQFIRAVVQDHGMAVLLVPHDIPLDGDSKKNDAVYMQQILDAVSNLGRKVCMMDSTLNASQIKQVISQCRFFIGARTHATIAALSSAVPTMSIAYSVKARGINQDLFGHQNTVLETPALSKDILIEKFEWLFANETAIQNQLKDKLNTVKQQAVNAMQQIGEILS